MIHVDKRRQMVNGIKSFEYSPLMEGETLARRHSLSFCSLVASTCASSSQDCVVPLWSPEVDLHWPFLPGLMGKPPDVCCGPALSLERPRQNVQLEERI